MTGARWRPALRVAAAVLCGILVLTSCATHEQSAIDPAGPQSGKIAA
jgi:hypothetical protein